MMQIVSFVYFSSQNQVNDVLVGIIFFNQDFLHFTMGSLHYRLLRACESSCVLPYLSERDLIAQVVPQVAQFSQRLLDHVFVCLVGHFLEQQLPLVAKLLHVDLLLIHLHFVLLEEQEGCFNWAKS